MTYQPPADPKERVILTRKLLAFYRDEVRAGQTITVPMIESAIACGFDRDAKPEPTRPARKPATGADD